MQDASLVQVFESRKDLSQVVAHLWLQQGVPGLPDVGQRLRRATVSVPGLPSPALPPSELDGEEARSPALDLKAPLPLLRITIPHLSAAELQENVYVVSILKVVRKTHDVAVLQAAVQLNLI